MGPELRQHTGHLGEGGKAMWVAICLGYGSPPWLPTRIIWTKKIQMPNVLYVDRGGGYLDVFLRRNLSKHTFDICVRCCLKPHHKNF